MIDEGEQAALSDLLEQVARGDTSLGEVLGLHPSIVEQMVDSALALVEVGKHEEAETMLTNLTVVDNRSAMLPFLLGTVRATRSDHDGAVAAYTESLRRDDRVGPSEKFRPEVHLLRAQAHLLSGKLEDAEADLRAAADSDVDHVVKQAVACLDAMAQTEVGHDQ